jgi:hypothetical protein
VEELDFLYGFPKTIKEYTKGVPKIWIENDRIIIWNPQYHKNLVIRDTGFSCCVSSKPAVLEILNNNGRILCFIDEEEARVIRLAGMISHANRYRDMGYFCSLTITGILKQPII